MSCMRWLVISLVMSVTLENAAAAGHDACMYNEMSPPWGWACTFVLALELM